MSCNNKSTTLLGHGLSPTHTTVTDTQPTDTQPTEILYGAYFDLADNSQYERLMRTCRRCGTKRVYENPYGGGPTYHRIYDIFNQGLIQECKYWIRNGYIQVKFEGPGLPTKAYVTIQPRVASKVAQNKDGWQPAFQIIGTAQPINKNKGFNISIHPSGELGGVFALHIKSRTSNHVTKNTLDVEVTYGGSHSAEGETTILTADLKKLSKPAVSQVANCSQYIN